MSNPQPTQQPWQRKEKLELLTETIRQSNVTPEQVMQFIQANNISPNWGDMVLPRGRTMNQSRAAYDELIRLRTNLLRSTSVRELGPSTALKRPFPSDVTTYGGRMIQPRPEGAPLASSIEPSEPPRKKRGRPTKAEAEERKHAALLRGDPYPPPRRASTMAPLAGPSSAALPRPASVAAAQAAYAAAPRTTRTPPPRAEPQSSESSSGKRKRGRPAKTEEDTRTAQESFTVARAPGPGPSRYPDILSRDEPTTTQIQDQKRSATQYIGHDSQRPR